MSEPTQPERPYPADGPPPAPVFAPGSAAVGGPVSGPRVPGPPVSGPPVSGPPVSGPPVADGPGYGLPPTDPTRPMSPSGYPTAMGQPAYPTVAMGQPAYPSPPTVSTGYPQPGSSAPPFPGYGEPNRRGRAGTIVLSIVAAVLLVAAGGLATLYVTKSSQSDRTQRRLSAQVAEQDSRISTQTGEIEQLKKDLQAKQDELAQVKQTLTGTQNSADEVKRQKAVIVKCLSLLGEANALADDGKTSQARAKIAEARPVCDEADKYLVP